MDHSLPSYDWHPRDSVDDKDGHVTDELERLSAREVYHEVIEPEKHEDKP